MIVGGLPVAIQPSAKPVHGRFVFTAGFQSRYWLGEAAIDSYSSTTLKLSICLNLRTDFRMALSLVICSLR